MTTFEIFPAPSVIPPSQTSPVVWPGLTPESTAKVVEVLKDNHKKWNIFFNDERFHNHISHHTLAIWALGAPAPVIEAAYKRDTEHQRPLPEPSVVITKENWYKHLGDAKLFAAYTKFFKDRVEQDGINATVEKYIFSKEANFDAKHEGKQPQMLSRLCGGLLHPYIHLGYGLEFSIPGLVIEGLAQAALHEVELPSRASHWDSLASSLTEKVMSSLRLDGTTSAAPANRGTHAFTIIDRMLKDSQFDGHNPGRNNFSLTIEKYGTAIANYADQWSLNLTNPSELERKIEELQWMNVVLYAVAGWSKDKPFHSNFFLMHLVTSSLFLPSVTSNLSSTSQALLLRAYLAFSLTWWVFVGRPGLDIDGFFAATTAHPLPSKQLTPPNYYTLLPSTSDITSLPNPWTAMINMAITNPDDHLPKLQRALAHYSRLYGPRFAGRADFSETSLAGAEKLDGTLFIRAAGLTFQRVVAAKDPEEFVWDFERT